MGALSCYFVGDSLGRRRLIFLAACILLIGIIIQATPFELGQLIFGRIFTGMTTASAVNDVACGWLIKDTGLGVGAFTATVPMWVSECAKAEYRGRLVLLEGWFAIGGIVIATWIEFGLYYVKSSSVNWRFPIAFQALFAIVVITIVLLLPESPRWLIKKERLEEAADVLAKLNGDSPDSEAVAEEVNNIHHSILDEHVGHSSSPFSLTRNRHLHRTILAVSVNILAQMTGVNIVTFYSTSIFQKDFHYSGTTSRIISACLQVWQFACAGLAVLIIDKFGRRTLLIAAAVGMAISQACLAGLSSDLANKSAAGAAFFFYFSALFFFPIGLFLIPFMYAAEIAPLRIRSKVTAMSASANWLFNFLLAEVTPVGFNNIQYRYYIVYAAISAFAAVVFGLLYPETKGRSLEEIDEIFLQSRSIWDPVRVARELPMHIPLDTEVIKPAQEKVGVESNSTDNK